MTYQEYSETVRHIFVSEFGIKSAKVIFGLIKGMRKAWENGVSAEDFALERMIEVEG